MAPVDEAVASPPSALPVTFQYGGFGDGAKGRGKGVGRNGRRALKQPRGISLDPSDGGLLVADYGNHCVYRFAKGDRAGRVVAGEEGRQLPTVDPLKDIDRPVGPPEGEGRLLKHPIDVTSHAGGLLVLDCEECRVQRFDARDRDAVAALVVPPPGSTAKKSVHQPEALKYPRAVIATEDGSLVICDTWSHRILRFPAAGAEQASVSSALEVLAGNPNSCGARPDQLAFPSSAAIARDGSVLVADTNNHRVQRFPASGGAMSKAETVAGSSSGQAGSGLGQLNMPTGICLDPRDGSLLVADRLNSRVLRFPEGSRAGDSGEVVAGSDVLDRPWGICIDGDGAIYVSDERQGKVLRLGGGQLEAAVPPEPPEIVKEPPQPHEEPAELPLESPPEDKEPDVVENTAAPVLILNEDPLALD